MAGVSFFTWWSHAYSLPCHSLSLSFSAAGCRVCRRFHRLATYTFWNVLSKIVWCCDAFYKPLALLLGGWIEKGFCFRVRHEQVWGHAACDFGVGNLLKIAWLEPFLFGMVINELLVAEVIWWMTSKRKVQLAHWRTVPRTGSVRINGSNLAGWIVEPGIKGISKRVQISVWKKSDVYFPWSSSVLSSLLQPCPPHWAPAGCHHRCLRFGAWWRWHDLGLGGRFKGGRRAGMSTLVEVRSSVHCDFYSC